MFKIFEAGYEGLRGPYANKNPASPIPREVCRLFVLICSIISEVIAKPGTPGDYADRLSPSSIS